MNENNLVSFWKVLLCIDKLPDEIKPGLANYIMRSIELYCNCHKMYAGNVGRYMHVSKMQKDIVKNQQREEGPSIIEITEEESQEVIKSNARQTFADTVPKLESSSTNAKKNITEISFNSAGDLLKNHVDKESSYSTWQKFNDLLIDVPYQNAKHETRKTLNSTSLMDSPVPEISQPVMQQTKIDTVVLQPPVESSNGKMYQNGFGYNF